MGLRIGVSLPRRSRRGYSLRRKWNRDLVMGAVGVGCTSLRLGSTFVTNTYTCKVPVLFDVPRLSDHGQAWLVPMSLVLRSLKGHQSSLPGTCRPQAAVGRVGLTRLLHQHSASLANPR